MNGEYSCPGIFNSMNMIEAIFIPHWINADTVGQNRVLFPYSPVWGPTINLPINTANHCLSGSGQ